MKTQLLGPSGIEVSSLASGCTRISGSWRNKVMDAICYCILLAARAEKPA